MPTKPGKKSSPEKIPQPNSPDEFKGDDRHIEPDQQRFEPQQDHHEHGNLPKRPGRPGTT